MRSGPEISIIIPTFNAEPYIERCLNSIIKSGADKNMYEIIAVDDSSTDKTLDSLKEIAKSTPQMKVYFRHKSGPGGARNLGMNYAKGRYIMFVDIDDHINSGNFAHLVNTLLQLYEQDIIGFDYFKTDESG
ncbi:MAG: glycosyltransferase family 2 protein, partial [Bacteroidales bacterium]